MAISFLARRSFQAKGAHQGIDDAICMFMALSGKVEVDHGGVQTAMAQILLDTSDINTGLQKMSGIAVPEGMNGDALFNIKLFYYAS
jgi:hypothetical protein